MRYIALLFSLFFYACNSRQEQAPTIAGRCYKLNAVTRTKHAVQPGEWRDAHAEVQEPLKVYLRKGAPAATPQHNTLYIVQLGAFDKKGQKILEDTKACLQAFYQIPVAELPPIDINTISKIYTRTNSFGMQMQTPVILDSLLPSLLPADAFALIAFTPCDLYPNEDWNFVFGQAGLQSRVGVWSLARLGNYHLNDSLFFRCRQRTMHVAIHETGHILGIKHCVQNECCMNGSNSLAESDQQPSWLCWECLAKVCYNRHMDPEQHIAAMLEFHTRLPSDHMALAYYQKALELLKQ